MKLYTNSEQTAKLIELGLEKPKNTIYTQVAKRKIGYGIVEWEDAREEGSYSIGELIEMLPLTVGKDYDLHIEYLVDKWYVAYYWIGCDVEYYIKYECFACELIDTLYIMILRLKEEGVI